MEKEIVQLNKRISALEVEVQRLIDETKSVNADSIIKRLVNYFKELTYDAYSSALNSKNEYRKITPFLKLNLEAIRDIREEF